MMNMEIPERPGLSGIFFCVQDVERGEMRFYIAIRRVSMCLQGYLVGAMCAGLPIESATHVLRSAT